MCATQSNGCAVKASRRMETQGNGTAAMALVVVTWEPMLHTVSPDYAHVVKRLHFNDTVCVTTACQQEVTGYIDTDEKHIVSCLTCLVRVR